VEIGDYVVLVKGVDRPFVLRSLGTQQVGDRGVREGFQLIGSCYVDCLVGSTVNWEKAKEVCLI